MTEKCPYYQGVCGLDEDIVCFGSGGYKTCNIYCSHMKELIEEIKGQDGVRNE